MEDRPRSLAGLVYFQPESVTKRSGRRTAQLLEAIPAVNWSSLTRFEWHLGLLSARCADYIVHLARPTRATVTVCVHAFPAPLRAASWATDRINEPALGEEALLPRSEHKLVVAFTTDNDLVFPDHGVHPSCLALPRRPIDCERWIGGQIERLGSSRVHQSPSSVSVG
jgi:hypothetical protein